MHASRTLPTVAILIALIGLGAPLLAETAAEVPKDAYYNDPLTADERSGIAEEESISANDGRASLPPAADDGVIPDAAIDRPAKAETPAKGESEAEIVLDDAKKNAKVTKNGLADCMKNWDPQTQMTKAEWKESCRTTLEYFPDGQ